MQVHINPGSGPVNAATVEQAEINIRAFAADLTARGHHNVTTERKADADYNTTDGDGRFCWLVSVDDEPDEEVQMPGIPLDRVRWLGSDGQDIWQFPRLYVDDSSWIWYFALQQFRDEPSGQPNGTVQGGEPFRFERVTFDDAAGAGQ
jgi:hypothetical protein